LSAFLDQQRGAVSIPRAAIENRFAADKLGGKLVDFPMILKILVRAIRTNSLTTTGRTQSAERVL
jgi:hypothetical protein